MKTLLAWLAASASLTPTAMVFWLLAAFIDGASFVLVDEVAAGFVFGLLTSLYGSVIVALYGVPVFAFMRALGWANFGTAMLAALVPWLALGVMLWGAESLALLSFPLLCSWVAAVVFWAVAKPVGELTPD
ncbi:MAG: hypothetical protein LAT63_03115 [Marinobacter sp.]|nr:hypothetical protein [Marinobacter sp.]